MTARRSALLVFFSVAAMLLLLQGNRLILTNDEGIILESAQRMTSGARLYVDIFGYMSPGSYWIQAALFHVFGSAYWVGRLPVIFDLSLQCALLFWLVARFASRRAASAALVIFLSFQIADPSFLTAQHRWDSGTFALASVYLALGLSRARLFGSGVLCAVAAWCTPSVVLLAAVVFLWLAFVRKRRALLLSYAAGLVAVSAACIARLATEGTLVAFFRQMLWLQRNYSSINVMPYGSVMGGYGPLLAMGAGAEKLLVVISVACLALPAILPPVAVFLWGIAFIRGKIPAELQPAIELMLFAMLALIGSIFPRADLMHLAFVAALPYALVSIALARFLSLRASAIIGFAAIPFAALFALANITGWWDAHTISSPAGRIRVAHDATRSVEILLATVHPNDTLFVYPYMPVFYFLTQANNPTRFSFLMPGMMSGKEEAEALRELQSRPPRWLLYMHLSHEEFIRIFPYAGASSWQFTSLESWLSQNYEVIEGPNVNLNGYRLWRWRKPRDEN